MTDAETPAVAAAPDEAKARHAALAEEVDGHRLRYHNLDAPTISDGEYDALIARAARARGVVPRAAHARLADAEGRRRGLDAVHRRSSTASG